MSQGDLPYLMSSGDLYASLTCLVVLGSACTGLHSPEALRVPINVAYNAI